MCYFSFLFFYGHILLSHLIKVLIKIIVKSTRYNIPSTTIQKFFGNFFLEEINTFIQQRHINCIMWQQRPL